MSALKVQTPHTATTTNESARHALVTAARELFAAHGFHAVSVRDITERANTNVSMVSYHFGGKEGLYRTCIEAFGLSRLESARRLLGAPTSISEFQLRIRLYIDDFIVTAVSNKDMVKIMYREIESDYALTSDIFESTYLEGFRKLVGFFVAAKEAGLLKPEAKPITIAGLLKSMLIHNVRMDDCAKRHFGVTLADPAHRTELVDQIFGMLCNGITVGGGSNA